MLVFRFRTPQSQFRTILCKYPCSNATSSKFRGQETETCNFREPKDHSVLKLVRRANSLQRDKNATAIAKCYGECSELLVFLGKEAGKRYGLSKTTAVANTTDSGAVLFLVRKGPLGMSPLDFFEFSPVDFFVLFLKFFCVTQ